MTVRTQPSLIHQVMIAALRAARIEAAQPDDDDAADYALVDVLLSELDARGFVVVKRAPDTVSARLDAHDGAYVLEPLGIDAG